MSYTILTDEKLINWQKLEVFTKNHPNGNFFQSVPYYHFYKPQKDYYTITVVAEDANKEIVGSVICIVNRLLPKYKFDFLSRALVMGGPLVIDSNDKLLITEKIIAELSRLVKPKSVALEIRNLFDVSDIRPAIEKTGLVFNDHLNFLIKSGDGEAALSRIKASKRQQIRKSLAAGVEIVKATSIDEVKRFYELLTILYQTKVKKPFPKWDFFERFFNMGDEVGLYLVVKHEGKIVSGMMCPVFENKIFYDWYVSGDDKNFRNLYPSVIITYAGIEYAVKNNIALYDFLGAGKPKQEYGVREFKAQFGGDLVNNGRFAVTYNIRKYNFSQWLLKRMGYFK